MLLAGIVALGCSSPAPVPPPPPTEVEMVASMEDHYTLAITAHDAVIRGRLEDVRASLGALSKVALPEGVPDTYKPLHAAMTSAAKGGAQAQSIEKAAGSMAAVGVACGACHTGTGKGPVYPAPAAPDPTMETHQWATERLWEGLTGPWDHAWTRGSTVLATSAVWADPPTPEAAPLADGLRTAGAAAVQAASLPEKADAYAALLRSCAGCHAAAGLAFPAPDKP